MYYPCAARLKTGELVECVYLSEAETWFRSWGVWPEDDAGKRSIKLLDIESLRESRLRLPATFANQLYAAGESGMGYTIFTVEFRDGSSSAYQTGNAVDFIDYPDGKGPTDVVRVVPHAGRNSPNRRVGPDYYWCLFSKS